MMHTLPFQFMPTFTEKASLLNVIDAKREMVEHAGRDRPVIVSAVQIGVEAGLRKVVKGDRQAGRPDAPGCTRSLPRLKRYER
jgi:hypothetical protein